MPAEQTSSWTACLAGSLYSRQQLNKLQTMIAGGNASRIAIFFWEGYLGVAPSLINAVRALARNGYAVDVITRSQTRGFPEPPTFPTHVRILSCKPVSHWAWRTVGQRPPWPVAKVLHFADLVQFAAVGLKRALRHRYAWTVGVDMNGLLTATLVALLQRAPVLYWSLEIHFLDKVRNPAQRLVKRLERWCHRRARLTVVQDRFRAASLVAENGVDPQTVVLVPNSPADAPPGRKYHHFHERFALPPSQRVVLHIGWIDSALMSLELAQYAASWPTNWSLVFHERERRSPSESYLREVEEAGRGRVLLSLNPVPYDQLDEIVASGDVGIVLYREELGPNFSEIVGASGKLAHYLRCGLPVVCADLPGFRELLTQYECGLWVSGLEQVADALQQIFFNYEAFSANAIKCYLERYEFNRHFERVLGIMEAAQNRRQVMSIG